METTPMILHQILIRLDIFWLETK